MKRVAARELLAEVREFGYRPRKIKKTNRDASLEQELSLAQRIRVSKMEEYLTPAELEEFQVLPKRVAASESKELKKRVAARELLAEVREFGYRPQERSLAEQERMLAKRIRMSKMAEYLTPAELEEFQALPSRHSSVQQPDLLFH